MGDVDWGLIVFSLVASCLVLWHGITYGQTVAHGNQ